MYQKRTNFSSKPIPITSVSVKVDHYKSDFPSNLWYQYFLFSQQQQTYDNNDNNFNNNNNNNNNDDGQVQAYGQILP